MSEENNNKNKCDIWGLSLSLRPPITNHDNITTTNNNNNINININKPFLCKREHPFLADEQRKMQKPALVIDLEEVEMNKVVVDSPNSTLSSSAAATGKRVSCFRGGDIISDDDEGGSGGGGGGSHGGDGGERKKLRLSKDQIMVLEQAFREHTTLNTKQKMALARQVNLRPRQVEVWFQNRRARTKLKQTEVDCEYLRRFCESLTEQNRKLQKEVQELRSMKLPSVHAKSSTVNMCPSCKTVSFSSSSPSPSTTSTGVLHRPVPLNLKKLSLSLNNSNNNTNSTSNGSKILKSSHVPHG